MKKYLLRTFFSLIILANLTLLFTKKNSGSLISEVVVSFQSYSLLLATLTLLILIPWFTWLIFKQFHKKDSWNKFIRKHTLFLMTFLILLSNTIWMSIEVLGFYYPKNGFKESSEESIKIGFYNKYFPNSNYSRINDELNRLDLDILGMGELTRSQIPYIEKLKDYKYSYAENCVCDYPEDVALYSKYPIKDVSTYGLLGGRVIEGTLEIEGKNIKIFVVHTTAPMSKREFNLRNQELPELAKTINSKKADGIILMGDFNVSPWSSHYKNFDSALVKLRNTSKDFGLRFTWSKSIMKTHLDHIFISKEWEILESKAEGSYGSDHNLIWASVNF